MAKQITFSYKDKEYILEFSRHSCKETNISYKELEEMENAPETALEIIPKLWRCAFLMHHPSVTDEEVEEIYNDMTGKAKDLPAALVELYTEPLLNLFDEQGNVEWKKSW